MITPIPSGISSSRKIFRKRLRSFGSSILRESLRSTLYSSRRLFSSNATRRSSFSTLTTSLFPVLRDVRPKIFFTLSNINFERLRDRERKHGQGIVHYSLDRH